MMFFSTDYLYTISHYLIIYLIDSNSFLESLSYSTISSIAKFRSNTMLNSENHFLIASHTYDQMFNVQLKHSI